MDKREVLNRLTQTTLPIVIAGAGIVGQILLEFCREEGIQVACFSDNSEAVAGGQVCGLEVLHTRELPGRFPEALILISVAAIKDAVDRLREMGYTQWLAGGLLLAEHDTAQGTEDARLDYTRFAVENCVLCHRGFLDPDHLFLRSIDIIITERCTLKCRDCSNLMQYYDRPRDCELPLLMESIDAFCSVVDEVMDFRVIGGEVFINREWHRVARRLVEEPKARRVVLYTNATLMPDPAHLELLQNPKVLVIATDYGPLSRRLGELCTWFQEHRVAHHVLINDEWLDCASIEKHDRSPEALSALYKNCCAKNMPTLSDGRLFTCPYAANAHRLRAVPDDGGDYVDILGLVREGREPQEIRQRVRSYLWGRESLGVCQYCVSRPLSGVGLEPAIQTRSPRLYHKF